MNLSLVVSFLKQEFGDCPPLCFVLGSGYSEFPDTLHVVHRIKTHAIPGVPPTTVEGHKGELILAEKTLKNGKSSKCLIVSGRFHGYEGHTPQTVVQLLRGIRQWGASHFFLTNAAGSTSIKYKPGMLVSIKDHLNFTGQNPLTGKELYGGPRFPDMSDLYSAQWRKSLQSLSRKLKIKLPEVVYAGVNGPCFETASEIKFFHRSGAHVVGMSTVWEAIALKQMGATIAGLSCVTNYGTGVTKRPLSHNDVLETMSKSKTKAFALMSKVIESFI